MPSQSKCPYGIKISFIIFLLLLKVLICNMIFIHGYFKYKAMVENRKNSLFVFFGIIDLYFQINNVSIFGMYHKFTYTHVIVPSSIISIPFVDNFWFVQTDISIWPTPPVFFLQVIAIFIAAVVSTAAPIPTFSIIPRGVLFLRFWKIADTSLCYLMTTIESSVISVISFVLWRSTSPIVVTVVVFSGPFPVISIALPVIPLRG